MGFKFVSLEYYDYSIKFHKRNYEKVSCNSETWKDGDTNDPC